MTKKAKQYLNQSKPSSLRDKGSRVKEALELAGGSVINGSLSTILGLLMLVFSRSFIFQSFFNVIPLCLNHSENVLESDIHYI
jgi:predicted RND superfamily exporter protein